LVSTFLVTVDGHEKQHLLIEAPLEQKMGKYAIWNRDDAMVRAWILNNVIPCIGVEIMYYKSAKQMWDGMKVAYSHELNSTQVFQIDYDLCHLK
jgi:hypothetical protein